MKKAITLMLAILMLCLCACGQKPEPSPAPELPDRGEPSVSDQNETEEEHDQIPPEEEASVPAETLPPPTEAPVSVVETKFYTLTLPEDWIGKTLCDTHQRDDGTYSMSVHEIQDYLDFGGGTLFTLMMLPTTEDYTIFPSYELLCALDTPDGSFHVVALFPTDVQFSPENADTYNALFAQVQDVLYTIAPKDGIEMAMP